jgi:hypothetical protein
MNRPAYSMITGSIELGRPMIIATLAVTDRRRDTLQV